MKLAILLTVLAAAVVHGIRIIQTNDDGWATSPSRLLFDLMNQTHEVVLSAPAEDKSGKGSREKTPGWRKKPCHFDSCPADSKPWGHDPDHPELNWVNSYAVTAMKWGIETFGPAHWDGMGPELVVSGINNGVNTFWVNLVSSTVAAAAWAVTERNIPAIAFSGWKKDDNPYYEPPLEADVIFAQLANKVVEEVIKTGPPYLPDGVVLNVNFPRLRKECMSPDKFRFIFTRVNPDTVFSDDPRWCGWRKFNHEYKLLDLDEGTSIPCAVSMSPMNAYDKTTVNEKWKHRAVLEKLKDLAECPIEEWWEDDVFGRDPGWKEYMGKRRYASDICNHMGTRKEAEDCRREREEGVEMPDVPWHLPGYRDDD